MKRLLVIHTGGTISMSQNQFSQVVTNDVNQYLFIETLLANTLMLMKFIHLIFRLPHITIQNVEKLRNIIIEARQVNMMVL